MYVYRYLSQQALRPSVVSVVSSYFDVMNLAMFGINGMVPLFDN